MLNIIRDRTEYYLNIKKEIMNHYSNGSCEICNHSNLKSLTIDHIDGNGRKHRAITTKRGGYSFYLWLRRNNYPKGYRVLCANCNMSIGHHGFSPLEINNDNNRCFICNNTLDNTLNFYKKYKINICEKCCIMQSKSKYALKSKKQSLSYKDLIIENYGKKCAMCEETNPLFLTIDHINGRGNEDREKGLIGTKFYRYLIKNNYPKNNLQLLCYNCNCGIKSYKQ